MLSTALLKCSNIDCICGHLRYNALSVSEILHLTANVCVHIVDYHYRSCTLLAS
jgi:hypothetical protein